METLKLVDPEIAAAIEKETLRQQSVGDDCLGKHNELGGHGSPGSVLTNSTEGYPGKRYYGGCEFVDIVENLAVREQKLFLASMLMFSPTPSPGQWRCALPC